MKSELSIYIRNDKIQLSKPTIVNGKKVYKRVSTGLSNNSENLKLVKEQGENLWLELTEELNSSSTTLREFLPYALQHINGFVKTETASEREGKIARYILPTFGEGKVGFIRSKEVEKWQLKMTQTYGADLTRRCKQLLKRIFDRAVVEELIEQNPVKGTATIRQPKQKLREIYTKEEVSKILSASDGWLRVFVLLLIVGGLRTGEAAALKRSRVDLTQRRIEVVASLRRGAINPPKGDERYVDMSEMLLDAMSEYLNEHQGDWLFSPNGGEKPFYDGANINQDYFQPLLKRVGVRYKSLYSLRHTFATMQLSGGNDLTYISNQLGHKEVGTTSKFYIKYLENSKNVKKSDEILKF